MQLFYQFTDSFGGVSKMPFESLNLALHVGDNPSFVKTNRTLLCKRFGIKNIVYMNQIHKTDVKVVNDDKVIPTSDGILTNVKNLALCVLVADCIPLLLHDRKHQAIGAIHAGRAGVFGEIAKKAVQKMGENFGSNPKDITAYIGSCINQCCYEIGGKILHEAMQKYPTYVKENHLDIKNLLINQLENLGLHVKDEGSCTSCDGRYFSYRKDGKTGRNGGIIMLKDLHA